MRVQVLQAQVRVHNNQNYKSEFQPGSLSSCSDKNAVFVRMTHVNANSTDNRYNHLEEVKRWYCITIYWQRTIFLVGAVLNCMIVQARKYIYH